MPPPCQSDKYPHLPFEISRQRNLQNNLSKEMIVMAYGLVIPNPEPNNDQDGLTPKDHNHPSLDGGLIPAPFKI